LGDARFKAYREETNQKIGRRSKIISEILGSVPQLMFNETFGAFYNTIIFREGTLRPNQKMRIESDSINKMVEGWVSESIPFDKRFVYYLLGAKGVCVVPISSFCSELQGFRVTLLEEDEATLVKIFTAIREGIVEYLNS
jgi:aspartate/methionine/tyrosine aminotransferase